MKCKILQYKNDGFTFLETIISLSIILLVISGLTFFLLSFNKNREYDFVKPQIEVLRFNNSVRELLNSYNFDPDFEQEVIYKEISDIIYKEAELYKYITVDKINCSIAIYNSSNNKTTINKKLIEVLFTCCNLKFCIQESLF